MFYFTACNVGDEGGFAPNIQDNKEGNLVIFFFTSCNPRNNAFSHMNPTGSWNSLPVHIERWMQADCKIIYTQPQYTSKKFLKWIQIRYMDRKIWYQNNDANRESGMFVLVWSFIVLLHVLTTDNFSCFVT